MAQKVIFPSMLIFIVLRIVQSGIHSDDRAILPSRTMSRFHIPTPRLQSRCGWLYFFSYSSEGSRQANLPAHLHCTRSCGHSRSSRQPRSLQKWQRIILPFYTSFNWPRRTEHRSSVEDPSSHKKCLFICICMLPDGHFDQLRASVGKIVERALDVWHLLQRSLQRYEPDFEPLKWGESNGAH